MVIPIICNTCKYQCDPSINSYINNKPGCPRCSGNNRWKLDKFFRRQMKFTDTYVIIEKLLEYIFNQHIAEFR